jgi:putative MATE family efflux protein
MLKKLSSDLTEGPILKKLIKLSIPIVLANLLQIAYQLTDTYWVGQLGTNALASVSITFPVFFLIVSFASGLAVAGTILVSQHKGEKNHHQINHVSTQLFVFISTLAVIFSILGFFLSPIIIKALGASPAIYQDAVSYIQILLANLIFLFWYFIFQSLLRGIGNTTVPLVVTAITVILNMILDPILIHGFGIIPAMGVPGAAIATVGCEAISGLVGVFFLLKGYYGIKISLKELKPDFSLLKRIFKLGLPISLENSALSIALVFIAGFVTKFGDSAVAAYGLGSRILSLFFIPAQGFGMGIATFVGQNFGARKNDRALRAVKVSSLFMFSFMTLMGILVYFSADHIVHLFVKDNARTIELANQYLKILVFSFGFIGLSEILRGTFKGFSKTKISMFTSIFEIWIIRFPFIYIFAFLFNYGETAIWYSFPIGFILATLLAFLIFLKTDWHKLKFEKVESNQ